MPSTILQLSIQVLYKVKRKSRRMVYIYTYKFTHFSFVHITENSYSMFGGFGFVQLASRIVQIQHSIIRWKCGVWEEYKSWRMACLSYHGYTLYYIDRSTEFPFVSPQPVFSWYLSFCRLVSRKFFPYATEKNVIFFLFFFFDRYTKDR